MKVSKKEVGKACSGLYHKLPESLPAQQIAQSQVVLIYMKGGEPLTHIQFAPRVGITPSFEKQPNLIVEKLLCI